MRPEPIVIPADKLPKIIRRFHASYRIDEAGCWIWTKGLSVDGYGKIKILYRTIPAHRASWIIHFGPIPELHPDSHHGTCVCHSCDIPACVNPAHLWLGSMSDNLDDALTKGRHPGFSTSEKKLDALKENIKHAAKISADVRRTATHCRNGHRYAADNIYLYNGNRQCRQCRQGCEERRKLRRIALR